MGRDHDYRQLCLTNASKGTPQKTARCSRSRGSLSLVQAVLSGTADLVSWQGNEARAESNVGLSKDRKARFLSEHPHCCFCGGATPSAEPDHVPSRAFFRAKQWPEGYEFPACVPCNRATRHDEQVVAMLSRLYPDPSTEEEKAEMRERVRAVAHNYPDVLRETQPNLRQLRRAAAKYGLERPQGKTYSDIPALSLEGPLVNLAVENFSRKLFCALYYKHAGQILCPEGGIAVRWYTNLQVEADEIPSSLSAVLIGFPKLERSRMNLDDQFFYRWGIAETRAVAGFLAIFRQSFAILGIVHQSASEFQLPEQARILRPYAAQQGAPGATHKTRAP